MTPEQLIKLAAIRASDDNIADIQLTPDEVDEYFEKNANGGIADALYEIREGEVETGLPCKYRGYYENKAVAMQINDKWIGWTYWYGGGKHGEPEAIDWIGEAYFLDCKEEEKLQIVRTFSKVE